MTIETEAARVVASKLTKAQRELVGQLPPTWFNVSSKDERYRELKHHGLLAGYHHQFAYRFSYCATPLGQAVRAILMEGERG